MSLVLHSTRPCERFEEMGGGVAGVLLSSRTTSCETTAQTLRPSISPAPRPRRWLRSQTCHKQHSRVRTLHALSCVLQLRKLTCLSLATVPASPLWSAAAPGIVLALLQPPQHLALSDLLTQLGRKLSDATIGVVYHRLQVSLPVVLPEDGDDALTSSAGQEDLSLSTSSLCPESPSEHLERARWLTVLRSVSAALL